MCEVQAHDKEKLRLGTTVSEHRPIKLGEKGDAQRLCDSVTMKETVN